MQILVLGMHRSGTSLVTRLINMMGAYFAPEGQSHGFTPDNPKGFWERKDVMAINDALLATHGCRWDAPAAWPANCPAAPPALNQRIKSLILDMDAFRPWVMKDPRHCLTLPAWLPHLEVPVVVIPHRNPLEVAQSLVTRDRLSPDYALALWEQHAVSLLNATRALPRIFVAHQDALADPVGFAARLYDALAEQEVRGLRMPSQREILAFIDSTLYRAKAVEGMKLSPAQQQLSSILQGKQPQTDALQFSAEGRAALSRG